MTERQLPARRTLYSRGDGIEIQHAFDQPENYGDVILDAESNGDTFTVWMSRHLGRDRDNYDHSADAEMHLSKEEAHELYLALHVWLEGQGEAHDA